MANSILYFPYINLPQNEWTARALIYYDQVGSIIPESYIFEPENLDPYMRLLSQNGLVRFINPLEHIKNPRSIVKPFVDFITSDENRLNKLQNRFLNFERKPVHISKLRYLDKSEMNHQISIQKFDMDMFMALEDLGIAKQMDYRWCEVEGYTAQTLMAYLASILGKKCGMLPATDEITNLIIPSRPSLYNTQSLIRNKILKRIIPYPEKISVDKLLEFKAKYPKEIELFRIKIEQTAFEIFNVREPEYFENRLREIEIQTDDIVEKMKKSKFGRILFGSILGFAKAAIGLQLEGPTGLLLGLPKFANSIYSALRSTGMDYNDSDDGLKYLALLRVQMTQ